MSSSERIESIALIFVGLLVMTVWYNYWVVPRDEIRYAVMDCMGSEHGKEAFDRCFSMVTSEK